jgi:hypothetical protein
MDEKRRKLYTFFILLSRNESGWITNVLLLYTLERVKICIAFQSFSVMFATKCWNRNETDYITSNLSYIWIFRKNDPWYIINANYLASYAYFWLKWVFLFIKLYIKSYIILYYLTSCIPNKWTFQSWHWVLIYQTIPVKVENDVRLK